MNESTLKEWDLKCPKCGKDVYEEADIEGWACAECGWVGDEPVEEAKLTEKPVPAEEKDEFDEFEEEDKEETLPVPKSDKPEGEDAPEIIKELIGSTEDTFYYMLSVDNDEGEVQDLSIVDQEGVEKYSAREHGLDVANTPVILFKAIKELEIQELEFSMFDKYLFPYVFEEEEEEEELEDEEEVPEELPLGDKDKDEDFKESRKNGTKHLMEMKITDHENNVFDVYLSDDGSLDTIIDVSGREFRFD